jgi:hypothetical protein
VARKNPKIFPHEEWSPSPSRGDGGAVGRALLAVAGKCLVLTGLGSRVRAYGDGAERRLHRACAVPRRRSKKMGWIDVGFHFLFLPKGRSKQVFFLGKTRHFSRIRARGYVLTGKQSEK